MCGLSLGLRIDTPPVPVLGRGAPTLGLGSPCRVVTPATRSVVPRPRPVRVPAGLRPRPGPGARRPPRRCVAPPRLVGRLPIARLRVLTTPGRRPLLRPRCPGPLCRPRRRPGRLPPGLRRPRVTAGVGR